MLSGVPFEELGFPSNLGKQPLPELTGKVLHMIPSIAITGGVLLGGIWWIINRRIELEKQSKRLGVEPDNDEGDEV